MQAPCHRLGSADRPGHAVDHRPTVAKSACSSSMALEQWRLANGRFEAGKRCRRGPERTGVAFAPPPA
eukprot:scaffold280577_cov33-Tisochrysis_lutea.AAC.1